MGEPRKSVLAMPPGKAAVVHDSSDVCREIFSQTLRRVLQERKGAHATLSSNAAQLHDLIGKKASISAILKWLSGERMPDAPMLLELSNALHVTVDFLLKGEEALKKRPRSDGVPENAVERAEKLQLIDQLVLLPRKLHIDPSISDKEIVAFSRKWLTSRFPGVMFEDVDVMEALGDRMDPTICNGDEVLYWKEPRFFKDNAVYVLQCGLNRVLRRVRQLVSGEFEVSSDNLLYQGENERITADTFPHPLNAPSSRTPRIVGEVLGIINLSGRRIGSAR